MNFSKDTAKHLQTGSWGEQVACNFLVEKGYKVLKKNYVPRAHYEIDLIMKADDVLVFVEVKTRGSINYGRPVSAVNKKKKAKLQHAIAAYLKKLRKEPPYFRIDVVEVVGSPKEGALEVHHIENAFNLSDRYTF